MKWLALALAGLLAGPVLAQAVAEPEGYRGEPYRAAVPETLDGALVLDAKAARALWWSGRVAFVDAMPAPERPANLPEGTLWRDAPRETVPGAIWLANTGYQGLDPETADYFRDGLRAATEGDPQMPVVFFCQRDCWMSWNAAKRAMAEGYARVAWFPEGVDGWREAGWPLETVAAFGR